MASNDQWPPVASPPCGKGHIKGKNNTQKKKDHQQMVLKLVTEMFETTLEQDVISSLAESCNWELQSTIDALIALSSTVESPIKNTFIENKKTVSNISQCQQSNSEIINEKSSDKFFEMDQTELKKQLEEFTKFEQLRKNSTKNRMDSFKGNIKKLNKSLDDVQVNIKEKKKPVIPSSSWSSINDSKKRDKIKIWQSSDSSFVPSNLLKKKDQSDPNKLFNISQSITSNTQQTTNTSSKRCQIDSNKPTGAHKLCGLQIHYRSPGTDCSSDDDDDADVVIEEEFNDYNTSSEISVNVSQFLSSSTSKKSFSDTKSCKEKATTTAKIPKIQKKTVYDATFDRIKRAIDQGDRIMIILRGLPGCGKSTLAKNIITMNGCNKGDSSLHIFSSDDYFRQNKLGLYIYDPSKMNEAHSSNHRRVLNALKSSISPVIIDNTNLQAWEMRSYAAKAVQYNYNIEVLDVITPWANNVNELVKRNVHGVPKHKIIEMQNRYERGITGQKLIELYSLKYPTNKTLEKINVTNNTDVPNVDDIAILDNTNHTSDIIQNKNDSLVSTIKSDENILLNCYEELVDSKINVQTEINVIEETLEQKNEISRASEKNIYSMQLFGAIGSERKNNIVPSEFISSSREMKINSDCEGNEKMLSQCWDFILLLNGETLHSNHCNDEYYSYNLPKSQIYIDKIQKQDKEFGKEEKCVIIKFPLLMTPMTNLLQIDYDNFNLNNMKEVIEILTQKYNNTIGNSDKKNFNVTIANIMVNTSSSEMYTKIKYPIQYDREYNNNNFKQFEQIPITVLFSIDEMADDNNDHVKIILSNGKNDLNSGETIELNDLSVMMTKSKNEIPEIIINDDTSQSMVNSTFTTLLNMIKTTILGDNSTDKKKIPKYKDKKVYRDSIKKPIFGEHETELITRELNTSEWQKWPLNYSNQMINNGTIKNTTQDMYCPKTVHKFTLNNDTTTYCEPTNDEQHDKFDNINRITWEESPFPIDDMPQAKCISQVSSIPKSAMTVDASTNTTYYDFNVAYIGGTSEPGYRVLETHNRHINEMYKLPVVNPQRPPFKLMLDKSSMTGDIFNREGNPDLKDDNEHTDRIPKLIELFPHIPREYIIEIYEKLCMKDFDWAVEVLLDGVPNDVSNDGTIETTRLESPIEVEMIDNEISSESVHNISNEPSNLGNICLESAEKVDSIEKKLDLCASTEYYNHTQQYQQFDQYTKDNCEIDIVEECIKNAEYLKQEKNNNLDDMSLYSAALNKSQEFLEDEMSVKSEETMELNLGFEFIHTLESQFGNPDFHIPEGFKPTISIKKSIAKQLYTLWIESMYQQLKARHNQLDQMIAKDAEFAKSLEQELQLEEARVYDNNCDPCTNAVPNLEEIMDMELALAYYKNEMKSILNKEIPDNMASRLSRQMLHESLPDLDPETFNNILKAHDGNYKKVFDIIESNTGRSITPCGTFKKASHNNYPENVKKININGILDGNDDNDNDDNNNDDDEEEDDNDDNDDDDDDDDEDDDTTNCKSGNKLSPHKNALIKAANSRKEVQNQFSLRMYNFSKATEAYKRGYPQVAAYYSEIARLHSKNAHVARADATSALVKAQIFGNNENTLDLHYLFVTEALQALDEFLDYHLNKLAKTDKKKSTTLYIITGRGARSNSGTSKIKPAVSKKLLTRNIRFTEENPGCLKVHLYRKNIISHNL